MQHPSQAWPGQDTFCYWDWGFTGIKPLPTPLEDEGRGVEGPGEQGQWPETGQGFPWSPLGFQLAPHPLTVTRSGDSRGVPER